MVDTVQVQAREELEKKTDAFVAVVRTGSPVSAEAEATTEAHADFAAPMVDTVQTLQRAVEALAADLAAEVRAREELAAASAAAASGTPAAPAAGATIVEAAAPG